MASSSPPPPPLSPPSSLLPLPPTPPRQSRKQRTNPSITPRRFRRFFTPRSDGAHTNTVPRHALYDITSPLNNQHVTQSSPIRSSQSNDMQENSTSSFPRHLKRQKITHSPESTPENKRSGVRGSAERDSDYEDLTFQSSPCGKASIRGRIAKDTNGEDSIPALQRIVPSSDRGLAGRLLQISLGGSSRGVRRRYEYPVNDYQDETQAFSSNVDNVHMCQSLEGPDMCIPFVTASLNTNSLTAVGDEQGGVRLLESKEGEAPAFKDHYHAFKVHNNAIIDMTFSEDDSLLATASGDSTGRVVDMTTQNTIAILGNHHASLKQIRFQPGSNNRNVVATSSRDGSVQIWDLRCTGFNGPQNNLQIPIEPHRSTAGRLANLILYGRPINSIYHAHEVDPAEPPFVTPQAALTVPPPELTRMGDVSVTSLQFLPSGQEHLILTASERNAEVRLWDIRTISSRRKLQIPIAITKKPKMHTQWRHFGITSMNLSTDGARLFTLCKDNTLYAYSTAHLILGHAPELSLANEGRRLPQRATEEGLGPLHGYRHPKLQVASFYVKSAIRKAKNGHSEMVAVGSTDGSIVLFPTDERYLPKPPNARQDEISLTPSRLSLPALRTSKSGRTLGSKDTIPISTNGTALIRAHDREIGSLSWTTEGDLITVADDYLVRVWHQGEGARDLRMGGESDGRRWQCGWADVSADYDEDEF